jgi:pepF/M3 family oligoendopeptidase
MNTHIEDLPKWSLEIAHGSIDAETVNSAMLDIETGINRIEADFENLDIRKMIKRPVTPQDGATCDLVISDLNETLKMINDLGTFLAALVSVDSGLESAHGRASELENMTIRINPFWRRLAGWLASLGVKELATVSREIQKHQYPLQMLADSVNHLMLESEEKLYDELELTGSFAWAQFHSDLTAQLAGEINLPTGTQVLPIAEICGLSTSPDPEIRRAGYLAEMKAWPTIAVASAAALNSIKGEANIIYDRSKWKNPFDVSLDGEAIDVDTFNAMVAAIKSALPSFQRWMRTKGRLFGEVDGISWWNVTAPIGTATPISFDSATALVRTAFGTFSDKLAHIVDRAVAEKWIDAAPKVGKTSGAFCLPFIGDRSLVLLNWDNSIDSVLTLAHELGHAYHNVQLAGRTPLQKDVPATLAETASIFCETLVMEESLKHSDPDSRMALLELTLQNATLTIVDIYSRFLFETEFFQLRRKRTLGTSEINALMAKAQLEAYGNGLDQLTSHPYMWIAKSHYYDSHYYNWPYAFGLLFGLGLYAAYQTDPDTFRVKYDEALSLAGMRTPKEIGLSFGIDISSEAFWQAGMNVIVARIAEFELLANSTKV